MGPPPRSLAADAHECIMVRVLRPTEYKVAARSYRVLQRAPLGIVTRPNRVCHRARGCQGMAWKRQRTGFDHAQAAEWEDRSLERLIGLKADDHLVLAVDISGLMREQC